MGGDDDKLDPALIFPGPVALIAGPGSGKTTRLALRIKHLVEDQNVDPDEITVITFTVEAARNMKARLTPPAKVGMPDVTLPPELHPQTICTMHSLGWTIVGENAGRLGMGHGCKLLQPHLRPVLFEDAARLCGEDTEFGRQCADRKAKHGEPAEERELPVFDAYRQILRACNRIDFDDQITLACQLLREHEEIRETWQAKAMHLLVDEYQDINRAQLELIQLLSGQAAAGLFVVGDDDQSIYGFRGAEPSYIREFAHHFDGGQVVPIADCFRCQPHIIGAAHGFIGTFNPNRIPKPQPVCIRPKGSPVITHSVPSDAREAEIIAAMLKDALREGDVLILLPKREYAEPLRAALAKHRIAFDAPTAPISGSARIFKALRDWLADPMDNLAFRELLWAVTDSGLLIPGPRSRTAQKTADREEALAKVSELWNSVFDGTSLRESLRAAARSDELCAQLDKLADNFEQAIVGSPTEFAQRTFEALKPWASSTRMLDELASSGDDARVALTAEANVVRILTMRNSKGLEAKTVFVIGLEEGAFPASEYGSDRFEEDARLFYVSMTRAKKDLHLFHARTRSGGMTYKSKSFNMKRSPFLDGLPDAHCDARYHKSITKRTATK